jgi:hypothetical protein
MSVDGVSTYQEWIKYMSGRETSADAKGWKRGEKGFARAADNGKFAGSDYKKELLKPTKGDEAVGQRAQVGSGDKLNQRGY